MIKVIATVLVIISSIVMIQTFLKAFFSEEKAITIFINRYGEAKFELVLCIATILAIIYLIIDIIGGL